MFGSGHSTRCKPSIAASLLCFLVACSGASSWEEVSVLETSTGNIEAGDAVRIEPSEFELVELASAEFSIAEFKFSGTLLDSSADLELLPSVTVMAGKGDFHVEETQSPQPQDTIQWAADETQKAITISFMNMPTRSGYSGTGYFYFYLTDKDKHCVSNIVAWPVVFKE